MTANRRRAAPICGGSPRSNPIVACHWRGWTDARCGRGYPADYDTWSPRLQLTYEWARHRFAAVSAATGRKPRRWLKSETITAHSLAETGWSGAQRDCPTDFYCGVA